MPSTQFDLIVAMHLENSGIARQAASEVSKITDELARLGRASGSLTGNARIISDQQINQLKESLKTALRGAFEGSDIVSRLSRQQSGPGGRFVASGGPLPSTVLRNTEPSASTPLLAEQLRLARAELVRAGIEKRALVPLGTTVKGVAGYATDDKRKIAQFGANEAVERANKALEGAILKQIQAADKKAKAEERATLVEQRASEKRLQQYDEAVKRNAAADLKRQYALAREILAIEARARAEERAAKQAELAERRYAADQARGIQQNERFDRARDADRAVAGSAPAAYPNPDAGSRLGKAQAAVNAADRAVEIATLRLATERDNEARTEASLRAAEGRLEAATFSAAAARERVAVEERRAGQPSATAGGGGSRGGFGAQFAAGFRGGGENPVPYATQIGQAFKFSVFYGTAYKLLFGITETFKQTLQEGIEFQTAVSELKLATQDTADKANQDLPALAERLSARATASGFAPSQGVLAGARGIGLYGATEADTATQERIADISARTATRVAFNSGLKTEDVQTNIAAITNAFGLGAEGQFRVADLDAYFSRRFGTAPGSTIQAVAESANVGQAAGFDQEQINAIAGLLQGRTGQSATTVAGYMAQIFSRGGEGSLQAVSQRYGIDPTLTLADQIKELSRVYKEGTPNQQNAIAASFGRGKVQNAVTVLLGGFGEVESAANDVRNGKADGASDKANDVRLANLGGQIQITTAVLKEFANQLGQSGLLTVLGAGVVVLRTVVEAGSGVVKLWNDLSGVTRALIATIVAYNIAQRAGLVQAGASRALGIFQGAPLGVGAPGVAGRLGIISRAGTAVPLLSRAGIGAAGAGLATSLINPTTAAIGGLLAIGAFKNKADALGDAFESATAALNDGLDSNATGDQLTARASALKSTAKDTRDASSGFLASTINNNLGLFGTSDADRNRALADRLDAEAERLSKIAADQPAAAAPADKTIIENFDQQGLTEALDGITQSGGTAKDRLNALTSSLTSAGDAAARAAASFNPQRFAGANAQGIQDAISGSSTINEGTIGFGGILKGTFANFNTSGPQYERTYKNVLPDILNQYLTQGDIQKRLTDQLGGITDLSKLSAEDIRGIAVSVVGDTSSQIGQDYDLPQPVADQLQSQMIDSVIKYLQGQASGITDLINGTLRLTGPEITSATNQAIAEVQSVVQSLPETDYKGKSAAYRQAIDAAKAAIAASSDGVVPDQARENVANLERALAKSEFDRLENLRKVAQQQAGSTGQVAAVGRGFLRREINAAVAGRNGDVLATIIGQAGESARKMALAALREALKVAKAANDLRNIALGASANIDGEGFARGGTASFNSGDAPAGVDESPIRQAIDAAKNALTGGDTNVYKDGSDAALAGGADQETAADRRVAAAQAAALRSQSPIQQARAEIQAAQVAMSQAKKGSVEYYNALGQYYQARDSLTDAILDYKANRYLLGIDMTDPLAQAQVALRVARDKLRSDAGKGADVRAADQVAVRNAQAAEEAQKFQQRLDAVQTADDLGRISHQKYISYLQHEHDRLNGIKNRTYQQQQQLDQIDKLMQEAASSMNAQWNFGDIKLPTPYQVRRRLEELSPQAMAGNTDIGGSALAGRMGGNTTNIDINGADTGKVLAILREALGQAGRTRSVSKPRHS